MHDDNHKIMDATWSTWMRCHVDISTIENGGTWQQTIQWEPVVASAFNLFGKGLVECSQSLAIVYL